MYINSIYSSPVQAKTDFYHIMAPKRKVISLETKYEIITKRQRGEKTSDLMQEYGLASSTLATILKNKDKIIAVYESNSTENCGKRIRIKQPMYPDIDIAVDDWYKLTILTNNVAIGGAEIRAQAIKYATLFNQPDFKASNGWLHRFKERNNISTKTKINNHKIDIGDCLSIDADLPFIGTSDEESVLQCEFQDNYEEDIELQDKQNEETAYYMPQDDEDDSDSERDPGPPVTKREAMTALEKLKLYLLESPDDMSEILDQLSSIEKKIGFR